MSWDDNITDLVSGIPLKLLPIQEVNHKINLIDPKKCIHYQLTKCPEHFCKELFQKIERYTTAQWWIPTVAHQAVPMLCIPKKNSKLCTVFDLREQNDNTVKDMTVNTQVRTYAQIPIHTQIPAYAQLPALFQPCVLSQPSAHLCHSQVPCPDFHHSCAQPRC